MIACLSIPGFELKAALRKSPSLALRPAALAPEAGGEPLLGPVTAAAEAAGVRPRMRLGEALATMPRLVLVDPDPAAAEQAWEEIVCALEDAGFAVDPAARGIAYFETRGVERLYGALEPALRRALASVGPAWDARGRGGRWGGAGAALGGAGGGGAAGRGGGARPGGGRAAAPPAGPVARGARRGGRAPPPPPAAAPAAPRTVGPRTTDNANPPS